MCPNKFFFFADTDEKELRDLRCSRKFDLEVTIGGRLSMSRQWLAVTVRAEDILEYFK